MNDQDLMPFGKHKGVKMEDVPAQYLLWLHDEGVQHPGVKSYIEENMSVLLSQCPDYIKERNR